MADREWAFTGVSDVNEGISSDVREHLHTIVMGRAISNSTVLSFLDDIDFAVGVYRGNTITHNQSLPSNTRRNLEAAFNATHSLNDKLNELDGSSNKIISEIDPDGLTDIRQSLGKAIQLLNRALSRSKAFNTKSGRKMDTPRLILAAHIGHIISERLGIQPTSTKDGIYEEVLKAVIAMLNAERTDNPETRDKEPSVKRLILQALKVRITKSADDVLEFDTRVI